MKLLHTSDWHLGQTLHQHDREAEHARFLDWLLATLEAEQVDVLLVAGDVFDNTNPSAASQRLLYRFMAQARQRLPQLQTVVIAGNHDSPGRLEAPTPFLDLLGAHVVGHVGLAQAVGMATTTAATADAADTLASASPVTAASTAASAATTATLNKLVLPLHNRAGQVAAWCIAMPFLRPADVPRVEGADDAYAQGMHVAYRLAFEHAQALRQPGQALLAMGHAHIHGAQVSEDSERRIVIGGAEAMGVGLFDPALAYVALGHLHLPQAIGGDDTRRYSGSPLPMSFSEINYPHQVVLVELDGERVASTRAIHVPRTVDLLRVPAQPQPLAQVLEALAALPNAPAPVQPTPLAATVGTAAVEADPSLWPYLQVRVQLTQPEPGLRDHIEAALAGKAVRLVRIETSMATVAGRERAPALSLDDLDKLSPSAFFGQLYQHRFHTPPPDDLLAAFHDLANAAPSESLPS